jgi:hypothetical protein
MTTPKLHKVIRLAQTSHRRFAVEAAVEAAFDEELSGYLFEEPR